MPIETDTIDPLAPDLRLLADLIKQLPHRPSPQAVSRWCRKGAKGTRLRTIKLAGRCLTTEREFRRFVHAIQEGSNEPTDADSEAVDRQLVEAGYADAA